MRGHHDSARRRGFRGADDSRGGATAGRQRSSRAPRPPADSAALANIAAKPFRSSNLGMLLADGWEDYQLLDLGGGEKLERWGEYVLRRPEPQAVWPPIGDPELWARAAAHYHRRGGGGGWEFHRPLPARWTVSFGKLRFHVEPTGFKHTGLFPEQAVNWRWIAEQVAVSPRPPKILNLFAYTGGATIAAAAAGAEVCHVDAAKGMVSWARENLQLSGLAGKPVRLIVDDALKFVHREIRREASYDAIIMDPPSFGHGPKGEVWRLEDKLYELVGAAAKLLSPTPLFLLVNSYTKGFSPTLAADILSLALAGEMGGEVACGELGLPVAAAKSITLPCGCFARWRSSTVKAER